MKCGNGSWTIITILHDLFVSKKKFSSTCLRNFFSTIVNTSAYHAYLVPSQKALAHSLINHSELTVKMSSSEKNRNPPIIRQAVLAHTHSHSEVKWQWWGNISYIGCSSEIVSCIVIESVRLIERWRGRISVRDSDSLSAMTEVTVELQGKSWWEIEHTTKCKILI